MTINALIKPTASQIKDAFFSIRGDSALNLAGFFTVDQVRAHIQQGFHNQGFRRFAISGTSVYEYMEANLLGSGIMGCPPGYFKIQDEDSGLWSEGWAAAFVDFDNGCFKQNPHQKAADIVEVARSQAGGAVAFWSGYKAAVLKIGF